MNREKVYMVRDFTNDRGWCYGRLLHENGTEIGYHWSSSISFLREDLKSKLKDISSYDVVDFIGEPTPERFKTERFKHRRVKIK